MFSPQTTDLRKLLSERCHCFICPRCKQNPHAFRVSASGRWGKRGAVQRPGKEHPKDQPWRPVAMWPAWPSAQRQLEIGDHLEPWAGSDRSDRLTLGRFIIIPVRMGWWGPISSTSLGMVTMAWHGFTTLITGLVEMCRFPLVVPPFAGWTVWLLVEENPNIRYFNSIAVFTAETLTSSVTMFVMLSPSWLLVAWTIPRICSDCWLRRPLPTSLSRISLIRIIWCSPSTELQESLHLHHFCFSVFFWFCPYFAHSLPMFIRVFPCFPIGFPIGFPRFSEGAPTSRPAERNGTKPHRFRRPNWGRPRHLRASRCHGLRTPYFEVPWFEIGNLVGSMKQV